MHWKSGAHQVSEAGALASEGPHISLVTYEKVGLIFRQSFLLSHPDFEVLCSSG